MLHALNLPLSLLFRMVQYIQTLEYHCTLNNMTKSLTISCTIIIIMTYVWKYSIAHPS